MGGRPRDPEKLRLRRKRDRHSERGVARAKRAADKRRSGWNFMNLVRILIGCDPVAPGHPKRANGAGDS